MQSNPPTSPISILPAETLARQPSASAKDVLFVVPPLGGKLSSRLKAVLRTRRPLFLHQEQPAADLSLPGRLRALGGATVAQRVRNEGIDQQLTEMIERQRQHCERVRRLEVTLEEQQAHGQRLLTAGKRDRPPAGGVEPQPQTAPQSAHQRRQMNPDADPGQGERRR